MTQQIVRLTAVDHEELVDFISLVFSVAHSPTDFRAFGPHMYEPTDASMAQQYVVREGGRIRAAVGVFPMTYRIGDAALRVAGVGNVAVHKYHAGKGYMVELMKAAIADMATAGVDFSFLTGQRQRYQYFGYEPCGATYAVGFSPSSIKHTAKGARDAYTFQDMASQNDAVVEQAYAIYSAQYARIERPREKFIQILSTAGSTPSVIFDPDGNVAGYFTRNGDNIGEIRVASQDQFTDILHSITAARSGDDTTVYLPGYEPRMLAEAIRICENYTVEGAGNYRMFQFARTVEAFLTLKANIRPLPGGELILSSDLFGTHSISIAAGSVAVSGTDLPPDVTVHGMDIYPFLFGAAPIDALFTGDTARALALAWFPAPLYFPFPDRV